MEFTKCVSFFGMQCVMCAPSTIGWCHSHWQAWTEDTCLHLLSILEYCREWKSRNLLIVIDCNKPSQWSRAHLLDLNKVSRARQNDYSIITQAKRFGGECILVARVLEFLTEGTREQSSKGGWVFSEESERKEV